ncbi:MAG: monovalent cation:proton antiporter-2 (CPA2) family protein, partial [Pseudomonadota bacterium]|nr:monovalent cation:proton antiporter-2 (CPA2) family protein [Pseudomonadota bacterium]
MQAEASMLTQAAVFLGATIAAVPVAKRLGLGSVLGYLIAGIIIGPFALALVGDDIESIMHFAEFGVVMMLFLIGIELQPSTLWKMRVPIIGLGGSQVLLCTLFIALASYAWLGNWSHSIVIGMVLALSSTAIVLQTLSEKSLDRTQGGKASFAVLLFQDIAVIPILTIIPFFAALDIQPQYTEHDNMNWIKPVLMLAGIVAVIVIGRIFIRPIFRYVATTNMREMFTALALFIVISVSILMDLVGLSAALGAFIAGVVLAESEYRHELEAELEPFKGLLLGLFFISVGASINFDILLKDWLPIISIVAALIAIKLAVLLSLAFMFKMPANESSVLAFSLAQGGEFAFVLFSFAQTEAVLPNELVSVLVVAVAISMAITPLLFIANERLIQPLLTQSASEQKRAYDEIESSESHAILIGYGRFGQIIGRLLNANGFKITVLEQDPNQVELVRKFGHKVFYGDGSRSDLLDAANIRQAKLVVVCSDNTEKNKKILSKVKTHYPHVKVFTRAKGRSEAQEFIQLGTNHVVRETYNSALSMGEKALVAMGLPAHQAFRAAKIFDIHDKRIMRETAGLWDQDLEQYILKSKRNTALVEKSIRADIMDSDELTDYGWNQAGSSVDSDNPETPATAEP